VPAARDAARRTEGATGSRPVFGEAPTNSESDANGDFGLREGESPADLYVELAVEYLRQGQMETALRRAKTALKQDPSNAQAHNVMALIFQRLRQDSLAEQHFQRAIDLQPQDPYIRNAYASFLCDRRQFAQAEAQYKKAIANPLYPTPWVAMTNMGICANRAGNSSKAEIYFHQALSANPRFWPAQVAIAELEYDRGNYDAARDRLEAYFKVAQPTAQALLLAVRVERKLGSKKRAKTYAELLRRNYPDSPEALQL
jgi:type IV pilus assembly protein PilF